MKKAIILTLSAIVLLCLTAQAKIGDKIGTALNTDIVVYINNYAIPSFAVDGTSCVVAEDLRNFGFDVKWDSAARSLTITRNNSTTVNPMSFLKNAKTGSFFADLLETDIAVYANDIKVTSYAMNGYTMIPIEQLTILGNVNWVESERALKMWVDGLHIRETMQTIQKNKNESFDFSVFNGSYAGGGIPIPGSIYTIGQWNASLSNVTADSMYLTFGQNESDYGVDMVLYRQKNGSYYGCGYSTWDGYSYITIWLESPQRISLTVSGAADTTGTKQLYKE